MIRRKFSVQESSYYKPLEVEGLSVRERVAAIEAHLPRPKTESEARRRAITGLYAVGLMSSMLVEELNENAEFEAFYWFKVCADLEGRFQGNINSLLLDKFYQQVGIATPGEDEEYEWL